MNSLATLLVEVDMLDWAWLRHCRLTAREFTELEKCFNAYCHTIVNHSEKPQTAQPSRETKLYHFTCGKTF